MWLVIDCSASVGAVVLTFTADNSSEDVDYGGRLCCAAILQQVEGF